MLLDPTLNQRPDFHGFLRLLADNNPDRQLLLLGRVAGRGDRRRSRRLLREANFSEVEVGLQSLDPKAQELMGRKIDLTALEHGVRAMLDAGIRVRVDLILGLPGDTLDSVRRGIDYLDRSRPVHRGAGLQPLDPAGHGLSPGGRALWGSSYQPRPPYYVLQTPTLSLDDIYTLMDEAQAAFDLEYDPLPPPRLDFPQSDSGPIEVARIDLDADAEKGDRPHLCEAPSGPFRQMGPVPFSVARRNCPRRPSAPRRLPCGSARPISIRVGRPPRD